MPYEGIQHQRLLYTFHAHTEDVTLNYTISAEQGNNATAGADFTAKSGTVTILAGFTTATIDLPIKTDNTVEASETFSLKLTGTSAGTIAAPIATVTLHDSSKTINTTGELKSLSNLLVDKATSDVGSALTAAYNTYATSNSASWSIQCCTNATNFVVPGLKVIAETFYSIIKTKFDTLSQTSDIDLLQTF